jgi:hypothetical protein
MAAVHSSSRARQRSSSDPFLDPSKSQKRPPPPPPKPAAKPSMTSAAPKSAPAHRDITEAVRDTVTVRGTTDHSPRSRVGRSQTALSVVAPHHHQQSSLIIIDKTEPHPPMAPRAMFYHWVVVHSPKTLSSLPQRPLKRPKQTARDGPRKALNTQMSSTGLISQV